MREKQLYGIGWAAALLMIAGIMLCFSSASLGVMHASSWMDGQIGFTDTSLYPTIVANSMSMFVVLGSILFSTGLFVAVGAYIMHIFFSREKNAIAREQPDI